MSTLFLLVSTILVITTSIASGFVQIPLVRNEPGNPPLVRRGGTFEQSMINNLTGGGYYAQVALGTPPQDVTLIVDTGSSDVWVLDKNADLCSSPRKQIERGTGCIHTYDKTMSTTYQLVSSDGFEIEYLSGEGASGDYIKEHFHVGGATIEALQMGLAESSDINSGLIGVGFGDLVSTRNRYPNIMDEFKDQGLIDTMGYSLWLNDLTSNTGSILFGAIDTEKFIGSISTIPILRSSSGGYSHFFVQMSTLSLYSPSDAFNETFITKTGLPVILDSGTTLSYLPSSMVEELYRTINAYDDTWRTGLVYVSCSVIDVYPDLEFSFTFADAETRSAATIKVAARDLVMDNIPFYTSLGLLVPGDIPFLESDTCSLGLHAIDGDGAASRGGTVLTDVGILGDTFLRSAYVVYDLDNKVIGLAQANLNATKSNIVEMKDGIPEGIVGVASQIPNVPDTSGVSGTTDVASEVATVTALETVSELDPDSSSAPDLAGRLVGGGIMGAVMLGWMVLGGLTVVL